MKQKFSISEVVARLYFLETELIKLKAENSKLRASNTLLRAENKELKFRLNSNSSNSSKPPSSDGYQKKPAFAKKVKGN